MEIYQPEEDSYLLANEVKDYLSNLTNKKIKVLDMGSGSGIQARTALESGVKEVLATDINPEAIIYLKKQKIRSIQSNLFNKIPNKKFDLIIFNAPYLPEDKYDKGWDTTAGKGGYELIVEFLKQAKPHLNKGASILLLFSNLSKPNIIKKYAKILRYKYKKLSEKNVGFFEKLYVYNFKI